jgi:hypothetical protein
MLATGGVIGVASTGRRRARSSPFPCLRELVRAHPCDGDLCVMPHETARHHVEEMPTPVGDFRACAPREPSGRAVETLQVACPVAGRILALRSLTPLEAVRAASAAGVGRAALFGPRTSTWMLTHQRPRALENSEDFGLPYRAGKSQIVIGAEDAQLSPSSFAGLLTLEKGACLGRPSWSPGCPDASSGVTTRAVPWMFSHCGAAGPYLFFAEWEAIRCANSTNAARAAASSIAKKAFSKSRPSRVIASG